MRSRKLRVSWLLLAFIFNLASVPAALPHVPLPHPAPQLAQALLAHDDILLPSTGKPR